MQDGKLTIVLHRDWCEEWVSVRFNDRTFDVHGYSGTGVFEGVVTAALRKCLGVELLTEEERKAREEMEERLTRPFPEDPAPSDQRKG